MYGMHSVIAALQNGDRQYSRLLASREALDSLKSSLSQQVYSRLTSSSELSVEVVARAKIDGMLPPHSAHQSIALLCKRLRNASLESLLVNCSPLGGSPPGTSPSGVGKKCVVVLDRVQDPRNIGAVLRSAYFFGANGVMLPKAHTPDESAVMAKAASGALELVPIVRTNLAQALRQMGRQKSKEGINEMATSEATHAEPWVRVALETDVESATTWEEQSEFLGDSSKVALVFGSEGAGIRPLVRRQCDISLVIKNPADRNSKFHDKFKSASSLPSIDSLNLSNAVAVTLALLAASRMK